MADGEREREYQALWAEHERLQAELARLKGQKPFNFDQHAALLEHLAAHRQKLTDWRKRYGRHTG